MKNERVLISFDYALKRLLRNKANYVVLEGFLSELLMRDVVVKSIGEGESNKEHARDKYNRVDVLVEDVTGEVLLIELQFSIEMDFLHRMLYGVSKSLTERMVQGEEYMEVRKIYSINIVYFDLGQGEDYVYHGKTRFTGLHRHDELRLSEAQRKTFGKEAAGDIYPEYYILKINNFDDVAKDTLDEWIYFFKHNAIKDEFRAKGLDKAREVLDRDKLTPEERQTYDFLQAQRSHDLSMIASSKLEGRMEGIAEGREEGRREREKLAKEREKFAEEREKLAKKHEELAKEREKLAKKHEELAKELEAALAELARLRKTTT
ncbi:MAG: Rpn family recombination-promoting nuclease/putative transposase [Prevotellaceae bacterium]|nr:Rpn family recombination-promoting nuclease/putative transposase [Prevotellaceae bacterium]